MRNVPEERAKFFKVTNLRNVPLTKALKKKNDARVARNH